MLAAPLQAFPGGLELIVIFFSLLVWLVPLAGIVLVLYYLRSIDKRLERLVERSE
ncbi:hypothetical protein [Haladaptatus salinisoli]|uniref:hypothetical protein n=1 Tax=Haladaptatus salinisoli TaxID=2884876 RepID=UPI001D0B1455|nr:hypothetical protein [Haladaptatus salinisoli]